MFQLTRCAFHKFHFRNQPVTGKLVFFLLGLWVSLQAVAQHAGPTPQLNISFVKAQSEHSMDSLYFNVLKIENPGTETLDVSIDLQLPPVFQLMSAMPSHISIKPKGRSNLPLRLSVAKTAQSSKPYTITATAKNQSGETAGTTTANISLKTFRKWELLNPEKELNLIAGNASGNTFAVPIRNSGNVSEEITVSLSVPEGYEAKSGKRTVELLRVELPAGRDSSLVFTLAPKGREKARRSEEQLQITARNSLGEYHKSIKVNCYSSRYEYIQEKISLDNFVEVSHQLNLPDAQKRFAVQTRGKIPFAKEGREIQYSFMNYDVTDGANFWDRSYYNLNYTSKSVAMGVGQSYSSLGVDLYNTHGVFGDFKINLNKTNQLLLYSSYGLKGDITSGAAGYQYKKGDFLLAASSGYSANDLYKQNIGSAVFSSQVPMGKSQVLGVNLRGVRREMLGDSVYYTTGLQGNFNYRLKLGKRFNFQARNLFNTPSFYRMNQRQFDAAATACYRLGKNNQLSAAFTTTQRDYNVAQKQMASESLVDDYNYVLYFQFGSSTRKTLKIGPWYKQLSFTEPKQTSQTRAYNIYIEAAKEGRPGYTVSLITGFRQKTKTFPFAASMAKVEKSYGNVHFTGALNGKIWGLNVQYDYGPPEMLSNTRDVDYWLLRVSPRLQGDFFNEKLLCQLSLDYTADWGRNYKYLNLRSGIGAVLKNNWRISFDGYVSTFGKLSLSTLDKDLRLDLRFSLRKDFNWGKKKSKTKTYNVDTYFFRDDNKNGIYDSDEQGIPYGFLRMASERSAADGKNVVLAPVVTDKNGKVSYANIPQGGYEMNISRMMNDDGYFNFSDSKKVLKLKKDTVCYIPFVKAYLIKGTLTLKLAAITSGAVNSTKNIKVTATDSRGQQYFALTDGSGHYILPVAGKEVYTVSINNPYGSNVSVNPNDVKVDFGKTEEALVDFEFTEKARKVRMKSASPQQEPVVKPEVGSKKSVKPEVIQEPPKTLVKQTPEPEKNPSSDLQEIDYRPRKKEISSGIECWIYNHTKPDSNVKMSYWVVGVFKSMENASRKIEQLKARNIPAQWIYSANTKLYYVYIKEATTILKT